MAKPFRIKEAEQFAFGDVLYGTSEAESRRSRQLEAEAVDCSAGLERQFDPTFVTGLALREKQIQQNYRPIIGIHKWFARRPGTVFRSLLLAEYNGAEALETCYWREHQAEGSDSGPGSWGWHPDIRG